MLEYLEGKVMEREPAWAVLQAGSIGWMMRITLHTFDVLEEGLTVRLFTYLQVKEDGYTLFGFHTRNERDMFVKLISINGVGGQTALAVLSSLTVEEFREAVMDQNDSVFKGIKGVGAKTAARIMLEMKDKLPSTLSSGAESVSGSEVRYGFREQALQALVQLGFAKPTIERKLDELLKKQPQPESVETLIKAVLKNN